MAEKEHRYVVLKIKDIDKYASYASKNALEDLCDEIRAGRKADGKDTMYKAVVVEGDWPMYEETWEKVLKYAEEQENAIHEKAKAV